MKHVTMHVTWSCYRLHKHFVILEFSRWMLSQHLCSIVIRKIALHLLMQRIKSSFELSNTYKACSKVADWLESDPKLCNRNLSHAFIIVKFVKCGNATSVELNLSNCDVIRFEDPRDRRICIRVPNCRQVAEISTTRKERNHVDVASAV